MANKRDYKKYVEAVGVSACEAMMATYYNVEDADRNEIAKAIEKVLGVVAAAQTNANVAFDKKVKEFANRKEYSQAKRKEIKQMFLKINEGFEEGIRLALKQFNAAIPQHVRDEYKQAVAE